MIFSSALKQAVIWQTIASNPAQFVKLPKLQRKEMRALSPDESLAFLKAAKGDRHELLLGFALATGMRPEEYLALQWKDVNLKPGSKNKKPLGSVSIQRTLIWRVKGGGWYFSEPKTPKSRRTIPLPASIAQGMITHKKVQAAERLKLGPEYCNLDLVFPNHFGGPLDPNHIRARHLKPILEKAELPVTVRLYDLRHTCATLLLASGVNPKIVSERLGHASIVLTLDIYSHVLPTMQEAAAATLEKVLFGTTGAP